MRITSQSPVSIFANPNPGALLRREFRDLADARELGAFVAMHFRSPRLFMGTKADLENLKKEGRKATLLQFVGHGFDNNGLGGLVMAGIHPLVTSEDISHLDLSKVELVILTACSAGVSSNSEVGNSDTLVRSFLNAGAKRVIAPVWPIEAGTAREFLADFYATMLRGNTVARSLHEALLGSKGSGGKQMERAGFQLFGDL